MKPNRNTFGRICGFAIALTFCALASSAQSTRVKEAEIVSRSGDQWVYTAIFLVLAGVGLAYYFWRRSKASIAKAKGGFENRETSYFSHDNYEMNNVDAEKELEWLRKAKRTTAESRKEKQEQEQPNEEQLWRGSSRPAAPAADVRAQAAEIRAHQEKMKMLQYAQLPINSFSELAPAKVYEPLQDSNAKNLLDAIDQANGEFEPDELVRDVAIKVLAAFRTSNSVEALEQMALYDLSAGLRAKAVTVLADFDHESVFESILLACADPSREVRAAAARGLFRLNFDRAHAWKRLIETNDEYRMRQAVVAAVEAGIATKSFERLIHDDMKVAYEAFVLVALMIKCDELGEVVGAIRDHKDERVKFALLHVLKAIHDERSIGALDQLMQSGNLSSNVMNRMQDTIDTLKGLTAKISV